MIVTEIYFVLGKKLNDMKHFNIQSTMALAIAISYSKSLFMSSFSYVYKEKIKQKGHTADEAKH